MKPTLIDQGEFAGWQTWTAEPFEYETAGPFYFRVDAQGPVAAFRAARKHMNAGGVMHGGCLMTFADYALFAFAHDSGNEGDDGYGVTVAFTSEFLDGAREGERIEARGEVLRRGGRLTFVRGLVSAEGRAVLNFSGTIMRRKASS
jgi:uncharacterized protein (TIGR00369 family)